ncbi:hypothetical protein GYH30_003089 [Glycine max]|uniref:Cytochrome P450 n=1 Tax=Glycine max TaxID=3847 RepID=A0A0R0KT00_SOYBN|nr:hypothetical protein GYH30_003089 [Glycine max]
METFGEIIARRRRGEETPEDFLQSMLQRDSLPASEKLGDSAAMMWSVMFLHENRETQNVLRQGASIYHEDLNSMRYGLKVFKETLRMSNVLLWFPRVALEDCTIEGYDIKKGWHVNIDATYIQRFDEMQKPYSFIPFGSGPRTCLGINMAKVTMLVFLHRLTGGYT